MPMQKVILLCGKIGCGKTTYAHRLKTMQNAVVLSCDEIMLALFPQQLGDQHDMLAHRTQHFLFSKSLELIHAGISVILDWGFWQKTHRDAAKAFYAAHQIPCELHYIAVSDPIWKQYLAKRNQLVMDGCISAYFVDEALAHKCCALFEPPLPREVDVFYQNDTFLSDDIP